MSTTSDRDLFALLLDALAGGDVSIGHRVFDLDVPALHCPSTGLVELNPDASPEEQRAGLLEALGSMRADLGVPSAPARS